jgi:hypothetical protein
VKHDGRLDVLCCILDDGPLTTQQISARIGRSLRSVAYWLDLLDSFDLVTEVDELDGGEPTFAINLDGHPDWVHEAIERHRRP